METDAACKFSRRNEYYERIYRGTLVYYVRLLYFAVEATLQSPVLQLASDAMMGKIIRPCTMT